MMSRQTPGGTSQRAPRETKFRKCRSESDDGGTPGEAAPKASSRTRSPERMRPWRLASSRATGTDAADVLPYSLRLTTTLSSGTPRRSPQRRLFADSPDAESPAELPHVTSASSSACRLISSMERTAILNTSLPFIVMVCSLFRTVYRVRRFARSAAGT